MIKDIITDEKLLGIRCKEFCNPLYIDQIVQDLIDTANANKKKCLGLAANQVGHNARIFVIKTTKGFSAVINPEVVCMAGGRKQYYESCLSRPGEDSIRVKRYKKVKLRLTNEKGEEALFAFNGLAARVVQHELDHLNGVLI